MSFSITVDFVNTNTRGPSKFVVLSGNPLRGVTHLHTFV